MRWDQKRKRGTYVSRFLCCHVINITAQTAVDVQWPYRRGSLLDGPGFLVFNGDIFTRITMGEGKEKKLRQRKNKPIYNVHSHTFQPDVRLGEKKVGPLKEMKNKIEIFRAWNPWAIGDLEAVSYRLRAEKPGAVTEKTKIGAGKGWPTCWITH